MMTEGRPRIVLAVTSSMSLKLLTGFPEYLYEAGWDVHVVCSQPPEDAHSGVVMHSIGMVREPAIVKDLVALLAWFRLLRRLDPDVVVSGTPKAGLLGMLAAWSLRIPVRIYLLRGLRLETERGVKRGVLFLMEWMSARSATVVQSVSHSLRDEYVELRLAPTSKVMVIGNGSSNGVEVPRGPVTGPTRSELGLTEDKSVVGFVGRVHPDKGVHTLVEALGLLVNKGMPVQALLIGPEESEGSLNDILRGAGLEESVVRWLGWVPDARPYFRVMDVLCLPTRREGFPNVVLEAAAQGVPSVVSDVTGARDSVVDGHTGLLFESGNSEQLARVLERLLVDPGTRVAMGEAAKRHVAETYDRQTIWDMNRLFYETQLVRRNEKVNR